jgi:DNA-binding sugar fermentation-stimulating protein
VISYLLNYLKAFYVETSTDRAQEHFDPRAHSDLKKRRQKGTTNASDGNKTNSMVDKAFPLKSFTSLIEASSKTDLEGASYADHEQDLDKDCLDAMSSQDQVRTHS